MSCHIGRLRNPLELGKNVSHHQVASCCTPCVFPPWVWWIVLRRLFIKIASAGLNSLFLAISITFKCSIWTIFSPNNCFFFHLPYGILAHISTPQQRVPTQKKRCFALRSLGKHWEIVVLKHPLSATAATQKTTFWDHGIQMQGLPWSKKVFEKHNQLCNVCIIEINTI